MALESTQLLVKMSTRNIPGGKGGRCVRLTTSPRSRAECHEIWEPKPPGTLWVCPDLLRDSLLPHLRPDFDEIRYKGFSHNASASEHCEFLNNPCGDGRTFIMGVNEINSTSGTNHRGEINAWSGVLDLWCIVFYNLWRRCSGAETWRGGTYHELLCMVCISLSFLSALIDQYIEYLLKA